MPDQPIKNTKLTHEQLDRVSDLLQGLKEDARKADAEGDSFMLGVYKELLAVTSPIVVKAFARLEREERAEINKAHKAMRRQLRGAAAKSEP